MVGKIGRAWLGIKKFIRGFYVWVIKNYYDVENCLCWVDWFHAWWARRKTGEGEKVRSDGNCIRTGIGGLMDRKENGLGIQFFGWSWAKKMIILRAKIFCVWLFYCLFVCVLNDWLLDCYMGFWTSWDGTSLWGMVSNCQCVPIDFWDQN